MAAEWWDEITAPERAGRPIAELVDGLERISAQPIPYGRLPRRARSFYSGDFATWSDLADQTISSLISRPKGGAATVRAIVAAARDAVERARSGSPGGGDDAASAALRLLDRLTVSDRIILSARVWALRPQTLEEVARSLGVSGASVLRNQRKAEVRFAELLADPHHDDVVAHAEKLRCAIGPLVRDHTVEAALRDIRLDVAGEAGLMLLYVAGPYAWRDGWLEDTSSGGLSAACAALDAALARFGAPSTTALVAELGLLGMADDVAEGFVESRPGLRRFGDRWVRWGASVGDKAEAVLHLSGAPATAEMIAAAIGENYHARAVREALYGDHRFTRTTRRTWALRQWGLDEYLGVFSEIMKRIDGAGGIIGVEDVVADMRTSFPDVAEVSVRTYLAAAPGFVTESGMVRRRTAADGWPAVPPLRSVRRVFCNGRNEIRMALPVTYDLLRGSGQQVHPAVATALGITPGEHRLFTGPHGDITLAWRLSTTHGPTAGSLRALAASVGAELGDTVVLVFNLRDSAIDVARIKAGESPHRHLHTLLGNPAPDPIRALARALRCRPHEVVSILRGRGDNEVLELIEHDFRLAQKRTDMACG